MIFSYKELEEYVEEDYQRFYKMNFTYEQIVNAVINEYKYGEDYCYSEEFCIYIILAKLYNSRKVDISYIMDKIKNINNKVIMDEIKTDLGDEYTVVMHDYQMLSRT